MEDVPEIPDGTDGAPEESAPFDMSDRIMAGVLLVGVVLLAYVCMDVIAGGRLTAALSAPPPEVPLDD